MIRDPSDGTVRETPKSTSARYAPQNSAERLPSSDAAGAGVDTGIRQPTKTDAMMRLEFSREWLKNYHAKKERGNDEGRSSSEVQGDS
jgi:hypothetical protein